MTIKVAINGYGRIGRNILRAHYEGGKKHDIAIVAINDLGSAETNVHRPIERIAPVALTYRVPLGRSACNARPLPDPSRYLRAMPGRTRHRPTPHVRL